MANPEHVTIVKQGAKAIRRWQGEHPLFCLDLIEADLRNANLRGADLEGAILGIRVRRDTVRSQPLRAMI